MRRMVAHEITSLLAQAVQKDPVVITADTCTMRCEHDITTRWFYRAAAVGTSNNHQARQVAVLLASLAQSLVKLAQNVYLQRVLFFGTELGA